ncbi:MAG: hypothetical protein ACRYG8_33230 [Janthinobacterium lividum]
METLILTLDTIAVMVVIYFSYKGSKSPDNPEIGPFRIRPYVAPEKPAAPTNARDRRR